MGVVLATAGGKVNDMRHAIKSASISGVVRVLLLVSAFSPLSLLSGCDIVPSDGPLASEIQRSSAQPPSNQMPETHIVFDIVQVDQRVANSVTQLGQTSLVRTFGVGGAPSTPVIGVGDELKVVIFEAGTDGLFSSENHKSTVIPVLVQPDGTVQIPYAGSIHFAGKTLEQARAEVINALKSKAVEPDVIVSMDKNLSRTASVQGAVKEPNLVPLGLAPLPLTSAIALAGGPMKAPYDTTITVTRGRKSSTVLMQSIIDNPKDDIYIRPGDKVFLTYDPQTFTVLGSVGKSSKIPFNASSLSLIEAAAMAGGTRSDLADPRGYFVFRYESEPVYRQLVGEKRFTELLEKGMLANRDGRYPIVYRIDMTDPQSYLVTQSFPVQNKDVLYLSRHPATDFLKFVAMVSSPVKVWRDVDAIQATN